MSNVVLDASALLALLNAEKGADLVQESLPHAIISTVNYAEVVARLSLLDMPDDKIHNALDMLGLDIIPFDQEQAFQSGLFASQTRSVGLSPGDRAWKKLQVGVEIHLIR